MAPLESIPGHSVQPVAMRNSGSVVAMSNPMFKGDPSYTGAWTDAAYDPETPGPIYHPGECLHRAPRGQWDASLSASLRTYLTHPRLCAQQADQICVNKSIDDVLREYTKAAIIASNSEEPPEDMVEWSRQWFVQQNKKQQQLSSQ